MNPTQLGAAPLMLLIASLVIAIVLLAIRVFVMQRVQTRRQRENRQETERLKSLVAAYRSLAGSFTPAAGEQRLQMEEALSDIVLFGTLEQVDLAATCANALARGESVDYQPLVLSLRSELRVQLGLDALPDDLALPRSGPGRARAGRDGEGGGGRGGGGAGGGGGGGGAGGGAAAGMGAGVVITSSSEAGER
jgi:uncharacterized membrane protein YgcG